MNEYIFINQAFTEAINMYISSKQTGNSSDFSSFLVIAIRSLIAIYGELDIINPYRTNNEDRMGGFDTNLTKFGFPKEKLQQFKADFQNYVNATNAQKFPNPYFINIQKNLMDMFGYKKKAVNISEEELQNFQKLLYITTNPNPMVQQIINKNTNTPQILDMFWQSRLFESNHDFQLKPYKRNTLLPEAYQVLGYTLDMIAQMDENTLEELNKQILSFFKIDMDDPKKLERLKEAVTYYQQYGSTITTGNGYVDMLMLLSIIATIMMTLFVITVKILGG